MVDKTKLYKVKIVDRLTGQEWISRSDKCYTNDYHQLNFDLPNGDHVELSTNWMYIELRSEDEILC